MENDIITIIVDFKETKVIKTKTFKLGDRLMHERNYDAGLTVFFSANAQDVRQFSGKNGYYYNLI